MANLRTVTLEILRPGPSHNQLLSSLTSYLAICDNRGAVTLNVPFEHREILRQREALSYTVRTSQREAQLAQTADAMGGLLGAIPSLNAALAQSEYGQEHLIHLRLVLSAAELALLPFELANAPLSFPGEAKPLLLQSIAPITMTREVRMATVAGESWARPLRILFAVAAPPGVEPVPVREHMLALRRALGPWVRSSRRGGFSDVVTVLPRASLVTIRDACASADYTHVHILAHGARTSDAGEDRFGLALFDTTGTAQEIVRGSHLAHALRTHRKGAPGFSSPNVVTVSSCDSSNVGSVVFPGASLAHDLHEAGLPWVIASQFPLSMRGSVLMAQVLYDAFARGEDPRVAMHYLRQCLRSECMQTHDWASVVAYAAVPPDFDAQVNLARREQANRAINVSFERADDFFDERRWEEDGKGWSTEDRKQLNELLVDLDRQLGTLSRLSPTGDSPQERRERAEIRGRMGSAEKRRAYELHRKEEEGLLLEEKADATAASDRPLDTASKSEWRRALRRAKNNYLEAAQLDLHSHWVMTQYLSICMVLGERVRRDYYNVARVAAEMDVDRPHADAQGWGYGTLAELALLSLRLEGDPATVAQRDEAIQRAREYAGKLMRISGSKSFAVQSTRRQFQRYLTWWRPGEDVQAVAEAALSQLVSEDD